MKILDKDHSLSVQQQASPVFKNQERSGSGSIVNSKAYIYLQERHTLTNRYNGDTIKRPASEFSDKTSCATGTNHKNTNRPFTSFETLKTKLQHSITDVVIAELFGHHDYKQHLEANNTDSSRNQSHSDTAPVTQRPVTSTYRLARSGSGRSYFASARKEGSVRYV